jgi:outer membrane receptor protein involved in Fe transport
MEIPYAKTFLAGTILFSCLFFFPLVSSAQFTASGFVKGVILNGSNKAALGNVLIQTDSNKLAVETYPDGSFTLAIKPGKYQFKASLKGFQSKILDSILISSGEFVQVSITLYPLKQKDIGSNGKPGMDSVAMSDTIKKAGNEYSTVVNQGLYRNASWLMRSLPGVNSFDHFPNSVLQSLTINGMGERYNQVLLNDLPMASFEQYSKAFPFELLPVEAIETAAVIDIPNAAIPADFSGGSVNIKVKDMPEANFIYLQGGAGFFGNGTSDKFYGDKKGSLQWLGIGGKNRNLPDNFPTTRSRTLLGDYNIQQQAAYSKQMKNNLAPQDYSQTIPSNKIQVGFGRMIKLKKGAKLGIIAHLVHLKTQDVYSNEVQARANVTENPFPFSDASKPFVQSFSNDTSFRLQSQVAGVISISYINKRSKYSFRNFLGSQFLNSYTQRSNIIKPDEDTAAHYGIHYQTEQRYFLNSQLAGEHILNAQQSFRLNWQAGYSYFNQQNPDERNLLLQQEGTGKANFRLATQSEASLTNDALRFTNSGRSWKNLTDHNFSAAVNLSLDFNWLGYAQQFKGGLFLQSLYRVFYSDIFLLNQKSTDYVPVDQLLSSDKYYPEGLTMVNFYKKLPLDGNNLAFTSTIANFGNYLGSSSLGAAYGQFSNQFSKKFTLVWGGRAETISQVTSSTQYQYKDAFKNPQLFTISLNSRTAKLSLLPFATISYKPFKQLTVFGSYSKSLNRPQLQELANYNEYNSASFMVRTGNSLLQAASIDNFSAGITWRDAHGTYLNVTGFYKTIDRPIEYLLLNYAGGNLISVPRNMPSAKVQGIRADLRLSLASLSKCAVCEHFALFASGNILESMVNNGPVIGDYSLRISSGIANSIFVPMHTLSGSPGYSFKGGLSFHSPKLPSLTVIYQQTGDYLQTVGSGTSIALKNGNTVTAVPAIRVGEMNQLDVQLAQKIFKSSIQIIAGVNNLLESSFVSYQDLNGNKKFDKAAAVTLKNNRAYYGSGVDNTIFNIKTKRQIYVTVSFLFR